MIVTCPGCSSRYAVQEEALGSGKLVRCSACGAVWKQFPRDEATIRRQRVFDILKWTFFYCVVFSSVFLLLFCRDIVIKIWPASESFYEFISQNSKVARDNLCSLENVSYFFVRKHGDLYVGLRGELKNSSSEVILVPSATIILENDPEFSADKFKKVWTHKIQYEKLLPMQKVLFETKLQRVPYNNLKCSIKLNYM